MMENDRFQKRQNAQLIDELLNANSRSFPGDGENVKFLRATARETAIYSRWSGRKQIVTDFHQFLSL